MGSVRTTGGCKRANVGARRPRSTLLLLLPRRAATAAPTRPTAALWCVAWLTVLSVIGLASGAGAASVAVGGTGATDTATCGVPPARPCASLRYAVEVRAANVSDGVRPVAVHMAASGTYPSAGNCNVTVPCNVAVSGAARVACGAHTPLLRVVAAPHSVSVAGAHVTAAVVVDAAWVCTTTAAPAITLSSVTVTGGAVVATTGAGCVSPAVTVAGTTVAAADTGAGVATAVDVDVGDAPGALVNVTGSWVTGGRVVVAGRTSPNATLVLSNSTFAGSVAGSGVQWSVTALSGFATAHVHGCAFVGNAGGARGGGLALSLDAGGSGGAVASTLPVAVAVAVTVTVTVTGSSFVNNTAAGDGGGLFVGTSTAVAPLHAHVRVQGCTLWDNVAAGGRGGGVHVDVDGGDNGALAVVDVAVDGGEVSRCVAGDGGGGGVSVALGLSGAAVQPPPAVTVSGVTVTACTARGAGDGGGVLLAVRSAFPTPYTVAVSAAAVSACTAAAGGGGGVALRLPLGSLDTTRLACGEYRTWRDDGRVAVSTTTVRNNTARTNGGGVAVVGGGSVQFTGVTVAANAAGGGGGGVYVGAASTAVGLAWSQVAANTAGTGGAQFASASGGSVTWAHTSVALGDTVSEVDVPAGGPWTSAADVVFECPAGLQVVAAPMRFGALPATAWFPTATAACALAATQVRMGCVPCPHGTYTTAATSTSAATPVVIHGSHSINHSVCVPCPRGANCVGDVRGVVALPGHWGVVRGAAIVMTPCPLGYCCTGAPDAPCDGLQACGPGRTGTLCGHCRGGYSQAVGTAACRHTASCPAWGGVWLATAVLLVAAAVAALHVGDVWQPATGLPTGVVRVACSYLQMAVAVMALRQLGAHDHRGNVVGDVMQVLLAVPRLAPPVLLSDGVCVVPGLTPVAAACIPFVVPVAVAVVAAALYHTVRCLRARRCLPQRLTAAWCGAAPPAQPPPMFPELTGPVSPAAATGSAVAPPPTAAGASVDRRGSATGSAAPSTTAHGASRRTASFLSAATSSVPPLAAADASKRVALLAASRRRPRHDTDADDPRLTEPGRWCATDATALPAAPRWLHLLLNLALVAYFPVAVATFSLLRCVRVPGVSEPALFIDASVRCVMYGWQLPLVVVAVLLFALPFGVPRLAHWARTSRTPSLAARAVFRAVCGPYADGCGWWEMVALLHRLLVAALVTWAVDVPVARMVTIGLLTVAVAVAHALYSPFRFDSAGVLQAVALVCLAVATTLALPDSGASLPAELRLTADDHTFVAVVTAVVVYALPLVTMGWAVWRGRRRAMMLWWK